MKKRTKLKTLSDINVKNKFVLLRVDLNTEIIRGKVQDSPRFKEHAKTIKELQTRGAKTVILAHQGRPNSKDFAKLKTHAKLLNKYVKVKYIDDITGKKAIQAIKSLKSKQTLLLENIRMSKAEFAPSKNNVLVKKLAPLFDYYVNDALSNSHRVHTSMVSFPKVLPSAIGRVMEHELEVTRKIKSKLSSCMFILGGAKPEDLMPLMKNKKILTTGTLSLLCLMAKGINLGKEKQILKKNMVLVPKLRPYLKNTTNPKDLAAKIRNKRKEITIKECPLNYPILDIGKETITEYKKEISKLRKANTIFFKGAPGYFEDPKFALGTKELLRATANSKAFSIIAGGSGASAIEKLKIPKNKFGHVSLSGGALVHLIAGKKLPGLEALK